MKGALFHIVFVCKHFVRFFEKHVQNLNNPQNNSARWDLRMGFNSAFKGLNVTLPLSKTKPSVGTTQIKAKQKVEIFLLLQGTEL